MPCKHFPFECVCLLPLYCIAISLINVVYSKLLRFCSSFISGRRRQRQTIDDIDFMQFSFILLHFRRHTTMCTCTCVSFQTKWLFAFYRSSTNRTSDNVSVIMVIEGKKIKLQQRKWMEIFLCTVTILPTRNVFKGENIINSYIGCGFMWTGCIWSCPCLSNWIPWTRSLWIFFNLLLL